MKIYKLILIASSLLFTSNSVVLAQKSSNVKTKFEEFKDQCADKPTDERVRITVARFNNTSNSDPALGDNMQTMLTNALSEINCFKVLESLRNKEDMTDEVDFQNSSYADQSSAVAKGNMLSAQVIMTGEITENSEMGKDVMVMGIGGSKKKKKLGFIVKLVDPTTREVLWTKSVNTEGKQRNGFKMGYRTGWLLPDVKVADGGKMDEATANMLEQGVIQAVEFLAVDYDNIPFPEPVDPDVMLTVLSVEGMEYMGLKDLEKLVLQDGQVKEVSKKLTNGVGILHIRHKGSTDEFLDTLAGRLGSGYSITNVDNGKVGMRKN